MKKRLFSPLLAAALAAAVALTAAALPAFADGGEETPITIGQSQEQQAECTCTALCTGDNINGECPVCGAEGADLTACEGTAPAMLALAAARAAALAAPLADGDTVYVGGVALTYSGTDVYAMTDASGNVSTTGASADKYNIKWNGSTLTLNGAKIKGGTSSESLYATVGIYAFSSSGDVSLNIALQGVNEIFDSSHGIWVYSSSNDTASLAITGENGSTLIASGSSSGILVQSNSGDATLTIQNADVTAENSISSGDGVTVRAGSSSSASLSVDGGSLTATGKNDNGAGIRYTFGSSSSGSGTPSLTVSGNTIVRANGGISDNSSTDIQIGGDNNSSGGIVFNNGTGTVYGDVTLQDDLEIGEGESLTLDDGASLDTDGYTLTVNGGTLTGDVIGDVIYKVTGVSLSPKTLSLNPGKGGTLTATITPDNATDKSVEWKSDDTGVATVNENGKVTAVGLGTTTITVTTADGGHTATCTVTVTQPAETPVTSVTLDKTSLTLDVGGSDTLTATVEPANATDKAVTWSTSNENVATVDQNGNVKAVGAGTATITAAASDGSGKTATCEVTVNGPVLPPQPSDPAPSQPEGSGSTGSTSSSAPRQQGPVVHNVSNSSAYRKGEYEFWMKVRTKIVSAGPGEVIEVNARDNDKMPNSVMQALAAKEDVTLRIRWNGGEEIVIPSAAALQEKMRMFYPLSYLAKFDFAQTPAQKVK